MQRSRSLIDRRIVDDDSGNASLEFITIGMILLVPVVYLVLTLSSIQAGAFAVEGAARQAARIFVQAETEAEAEREARRAIQFTLADYGLDIGDAEIAFVCTPRPDECLRRLADVTVTVAISVPLPLMPSAIVVDLPFEVPLVATATQRVSRFWSAP